MVKKKTSPMETNFEASRRLSVKLKDGGRGPNTEDSRHFVTVVIEFIQWKVLAFNCSLHKQWFKYS